MNKWKCQKFLMQEYIPVGCIPSAAAVVSPAMHVPCHTCLPCHAHPRHTSLPTMHASPAMHTPYHACPLPHNPPAMHAPCHTSPLPCMPPATHAPCHTWPPALHSPHQASPPVDRILDRRLWKHYLSGTTVADGNNLTRQTELWRPGKRTLNSENNKSLEVGRWFWIKQHQSRQ